MKKIVAVMRSQSWKLWLPYFQSNRSPEPLVRRGAFAGRFMTPWSRFITGGYRSKRLGGWRSLLGASLIAAICCLAAFACGKKGQLIIPKPKVPEMIKDVTATLGCDFTILTWTPPDRNQDGTELKNLRGFVIYRRRGTLASLEQANKGLPKDSDSEQKKTANGTPTPYISMSDLKPIEDDVTPTPTPYAPEAEFTEIARVKMAELRQELAKEDHKDKEKEKKKAADKSKGKDKDKDKSKDKDQEKEQEKVKYRVAFADRYDNEEYQDDKRLPKKENAAGSAEPELHVFMEGYVYYYKIVAENDHERLGAESTQVSITFAMQPGIPENFTVQIEERKVTLQWREPLISCSAETAVPIKGYNIYRSEIESAEITAALNPELITQTRYVDLSVQNDKDYYYSIRAFRDEFPLLGPPTAELHVSTEDFYPPKPPENLTLIPGKGQISLVWNRNREVDLDGYFVYRKSRNDPKPVKVSPTLIKRSAFVDDKVRAGVEYTYYVTAVDNSKQANESQPSDKATIKL